MIMVLSIPMFDRNTESAFSTIKKCKYHERTGGESNYVKGILMRFLVVNLKHGGFFSDL
jgi:hypothetical protein